MRNFDSNIEERRRKIISLLRENEQMTVKEISSAFNISEVTVRRDLETLAAKNLIERTHGAARLNQTFIKEMPYFVDKRAKYLEEKERIARKAAERIENEDVVFVNSGTTVLFLPKYITSPDVKIVTNNPCMATTEGGESINLIITGGERYPQTQSLVGDIALYALSKMKASKCILSANGISFDYGITSAYYMETAINSMMLDRCSGEKILIADSSKIGRSFSFISAGIEMIDTLITDGNADEEELLKISRAGVNIVIAD